MLAAERRTIVRQPASRMARIVEYPYRHAYVLARRAETKDAAVRTVFPAPTCFLKTKVELSFPPPVLWIAALTLCLTPPSSDGSATIRTADRPQIGER
jgi:hypothetical protein